MRWLHLPAPESGPGRSARSRVNKRSSSHPPALTVLGFSQYGLPTVPEHLLALSGLSSKTTQARCDVGLVVSQASLDCDSEKRSAEESEAVHQLIGSRLPTVNLPR